MFYAGYCGYGINCSFESMNGKAWDILAFPTKEDREFFLQRYSHGYSGREVNVTATAISSRELRSMYSSVFCVGQQYRSMVGRYAFVYRNKRDREAFDQYSEPRF